MSCLLSGRRPEGPGESPHRRRLLVAACLGLLGALASAAPALAHAELVAADPAPGIGLARAPGAVVLRFSEALNVRLSRIEVVDRSGHEVGLGQAQAVPGDPRAMQEKLGPVPLGVYTVRWTSTSADDGHTLQGSYSFGVATAAAGNETVANNPASSEGWLGLFGRLVAVIGLALWAGSAGIGHLASRAGLPDSSLRRIRRLGPLMVLVGTAVSFASSALVSAGSLAAVATVASSSLSGALRAALVGLSAVGFIGIRSPRLTLMLAAGAVLAEAASGHAASAPLPGLAVAISAIHLAAVGIWVFAIVASAFSANAMEALATFSPFAVGAAVAVAVSGIANAAFDVGRPAALASTPYGKLVVAKVVAFGLMVAFGLSHYWRRRRARGRGRTLRMPLRFEAGAAALALVLASALLGFPDPAREVGAQPRVTPQTDPALLSLGKRDALSLAEASGPFVVALTLLPPTPGPVELRVQVLGVEAGDGLREVRIRARSPTGEPFELPLGACGSGALGCFVGRGQMGSAGNWELAISITSNRGAISTDTTVPLPAPDGTRSLARAFSAMEGLHTASMTETLAGSVGSQPEVVTYRFAAPDAFSSSIGGSELQVVIGTRVWRRDSSSAPWELGAWPDPGFAWPATYYRMEWGGASAVRLLGTEEMDGVASEVVGFVLPKLPAWFELWVGEKDALVRRMVMRAQGHLMTDSYRGFNDPVAVEPPG